MASQTPDRSSAEAILDALSGPIQRARRSPLYGIGLMLVMLAMTLLPLIYAALAGVLAYGLFWHAVYNADVLLEQRAGGRSRLVVYVAPIVIGAILLVFMLKPFFARRPREHTGLALRSEDEPLLFAYVEKLCRIVRAPVPREIKVDCDPNASASFRRGFMSMLGSDLTLTIGLPLVASLSLRELTGVLAHEFGHFTQGLGMRANYVIRRVNHWFAQVVYERDAWDEWLVGLAKDGNGWTSSIAMMTRGMVWLTRRMLWLLMMLGHAISCFMSRRMEFDADRYEARVAGSASFASAMEKITLLGLSSQAALAAAEVSWREGRLPDDLPIFVARKFQTLPQPLVEAVRAQIASRRTGLLDTHPSNASRVEATARLAAPGIVQSEAPASVLFSNFPATCRALSIVFYSDKLGDIVKPRNLVPIGEFVKQTEQASGDIDTLRAYLGHPLVVSRPLLLGAIALPEVSDARVERDKLRALRRRTMEMRATVNAAYEDVDAAESQQLTAAEAGALLRAGIRIRAKDFQLESATPDAAAVLGRAARERLRAAGETLQPYEALMRPRILTALAIAAKPSAAKRLGESDALRVEITRLMTALERIKPVLERTTSLRVMLVEASVSSAALADHEGNTTLQAILRGRMTEAAEYLTMVREDLIAEPYPFSHANEQAVIGRFLVPRQPRADDPVGTFRLAQTFFENLAQLYSRTLGRLISIAHKTELLLKVAGDES